MSDRSNRFPNLNLVYSYERYFGMTMPNRNGLMVLSVLKCYDKPVSATQLSQDMSELVAIEPEKLKAIISETLSAGVQHGFIQQKKSKYYTDEEPVNKLTKRIRSNIRSLSEVENLDKHKKKPAAGLKRKRSETPEILEFDENDSFATVVARLTFSDDD